MPRVMKENASRHRRGAGIGLAPWLVMLVALALGTPAAQAAKGDGEYNAGQKAEARQDYDEAFRQYQAAVRADPNNPQFLMAVERARFQAASLHVDRGNRLQNQGNLQEAANEYEMAAAIDPASPVARQ